MAEKYIARLQKMYKEEIVPALFKDLGLSNIMEVPKIDKIIITIRGFYHV